MTKLKPNGNYKIGFTASPVKASATLVREIQGHSTSNTNHTEVKSAQAAKDAKKEIHHEFDKFRIKNRRMAETEWFCVDANHLHDFDQTYIKIANMYKSEGLNHLDEASFFRYSEEEARIENEKALEEYKIQNQERENVWNGIFLLMLTIFI